VDQSTGSWPSTMQCTSVSAKFKNLKDQTSVTMVSLIQGLKTTEDIFIKTIHCNNAGENVTFQQDAKTEELGLNFEFMA